MQENRPVRGSWKIGEFAGIGVYVHPTFLILVLWIMFVYWNAGHSAGGVVSGVLFTLALFACVVLHEFGHALTARHYGIKTLDITLLPIGGVSRLERLPGKPREEFYVALMGPAVSLVIALLLFLVLRLTGAPAPLQPVTAWSTVSFLGRLMIANATLAAFNLLPALPMDGGRIFRALLAGWMGPEKATRIAAGVGRGIAVMFALFGLFTNPFLVLIALFIWIGATQEVTMAQMKSVLAGMAAREFMLTDFAVLSPDDPLERAVELALHTRQQDFPVVKTGQLVGMFGNKELLQALSERGVESPVAEIMRQDFLTLAAGDGLETVLDKLQDSNMKALPVVDQGELVGIFTADNLAEFVLVQSAKSKRRTPTPRPTDAALHRDQGVNPVTAAGSNGGARCASGGCRSYGR